VKKFFLFVLPLLIAALIFFGLLFFLNKKSGKGALQVTSIPPSRVYLKDKLIGITPFCACDLEHMLSSGDYVIKLVPIGGTFRPFEEKISINESTLTAVDRTFVDNGGSEGSVISLIPIGDKKDVQILVVSLPDKANVFLDGNPVGITPLSLKQISESDHDLRITRNGYKDKIIKVKTALGFQLNSLIFLGVKSDLSSSVASLSATPTPTTTDAVVVILDTPTGFLRVREDSSLASAEVTQVKPGESYSLIEEKENWFKIKLADGKTGWISSQYASKK
jgi:hypothetical protein